MGLDASDRKDDRRATVRVIPVSDGARLVGESRRRGVPGEECTVIGGGFPGLPSRAARVVIRPLLDVLAWLNGGRVLVLSNQHFSYTRQTTQDDVPMQPRDAAQVWTWRA